MARHECCREIETAIFAERTNLPVLDFQTWQVRWGMVHMKYHENIFSVFFTYKQTSVIMLFSSTHAVDHSKELNVWFLSFLFFTRNGIKVPRLKPLSYPGEIYSCPSSCLGKVDKQMASHYVYGKSFHCDSP